MLHPHPAHTAAPAAPADPPPAAAQGSGSDPARGLIERQLQVLSRLTEIGMDVAEAVGRRAVASLDGEATSAATAVDPGLTFARVSRAVRMTIALQSRLLEALATLDGAESKARTARAGARTQRIHRLIERAIEAEHDDEDAVERLSGEAWERLQDEDDGGDLLDRPIGETVARICRDLGLSPDLGVQDWVARELGAQDWPESEPEPDDAEPPAWAVGAARRAWTLASKPGRPARPP